MSGGPFRVAVVVNPYARYIKHGMHGTVCMHILQPAAYCGRGAKSSKHARTPSGQVRCASSRIQRQYCGEETNGSTAYMCSSVASLATTPKSEWKHVGEFFGLLTRADKELHGIAAVFVTVAGFGVVLSSTAVDDGKPRRAFFGDDDTALPAAGGREDAKPAHTIGSDAEVLETHRPRRHSVAVTAGERAAVASLAGSARIAHHALGMSNVSSPTPTQNNQSQPLRTTACATDFTLPFVPSAAPSRDPGGDTPEPPRESHGLVDRRTSTPAQSEYTSSAPSSAAHTVDHWAITTEMARLRGYNGLSMPTEAAASTTQVVPATAREASERRIFVADPTLPMTDETLPRSLNDAPTSVRYKSAPTGSLTSAGETRERPGSGNDDGARRGSTAALSAGATANARLGTKVMPAPDGHHEYRPQRLAPAGNARCTCAIQ